MSRTTAIAYTHPACYDDSIDDNSTFYRVVLPLRNDPNLVNLTLCFYETKRVNESNAKYFVTATGCDLAGLEFVTGQCTIENCTAFDTFLDPGFDTILDLGDETKKQLNLIVVANCRTLTNGHLIWWDKTSCTREQWHCYDDDVDAQRFLEIRAAERAKEWHRIQLERRKAELIKQVRLYEERAAAPPTIAFLTSSDSSSPFNLLSSSTFSSSPYSPDTVAEGMGFINSNNRFFAAAAQPKERNSAVSNDDSLLLLAKQQGKVKTFCCC